MRGFKALLCVGLVAVGLLVPPSTRYASIAEAREAVGSAARADAVVLARGLGSDDSRQDDLRQANPPDRPRRGGRRAAFQQETASDGRQMRAGSLIVKFRSGTGENQREAAHQALGAAAAERLGRDHVVRVQVREGTVDRTLADYRARSDVEYAERDYVRQFSFTPNDPGFGDQYGLQRISAPAAWDRSRSSSSIRIAILDSGIWSSSSVDAARDGRPGHPDIRDKVVLERDFSGFGDVDDFFGHGTVVAGVAAAATNNGIGVAGVGFDASIMNGKVGDVDGVALSASVNGIIWAVDNGAKVINMSFGSPGSCTQAEQDAIDYAWARGVVIVAAAGNDGAAAADAPGNCNHVLAIAATDSSDARAIRGDFASNYGANVELAAPGLDILSLDNYDQGGRTGYRFASGTSFSAPFVAGLAALVWTTSYGTGNQAVVDRINATADRIAGTGSLWTYGRINAAAAVAPPLTVSCSPRPRVTVSTAPAGAGRLQVSVAATGANNTLRTLQFGAATNALIDAGGQNGRTGTFTVDVPAGTTGTTFIVRRAAAGAATTVPFVVVDGCGDWPTFVGGGPSAF